MHKGADTSKPLRCKLQRSPTGSILGACLMVGAEDLSFVDSDTEYLTITKRPTENGLILEIGGDPR